MYRPQLSCTNAGEAAEHVHTCLATVSLHWFVGNHKPQTFFNRSDQYSGADCVPVYCTSSGQDTEFLHLV